MTSRSFLLISALLAVILCGAVGTGAWIVGRSIDPADDGPGLVGGSFELTDQNRQTVTDQNYTGVLKIVYFGYTFCPDMCPAGLTVITEALDQLGPSADMVKPLFITIDPERDTADVLASYSTHFHDRFSFLTGTPEQVAAVARAYRVFYQKAIDDSASEYLMDHSMITYLMARDGRYLDHFGHDVTPDKLAAAIRKAL